MYSCLIQHYTCIENDSKLLLASQSTFLNQFTQVPKKKGLVTNEGGLVVALTIVQVELFDDGDQ